MDLTRCMWRRAINAEPPTCGGAKHLIEQAATPEPGGAKH
jgi:hypothetical protein